MSDNESKSEQSVQKPRSEEVSTQRRTFMKTVVTGTVAAGVVGAAAKAQAQSAQATVCAPTKFPSNPVRVKVLFNKAQPPTLEELHYALDDVIKQSGCPNCGLGGVFDPDIGIAFDLKFEVGHMAEEQPSIMVLQDVLPRY